MTAGQKFYLHHCTRGMRAPHRSSEERVYLERVYVAPIDMFASAMMRKLQSSMCDNMWAKHRFYAIKRDSKKVGIIALQEVFSTRLIDAVGPRPCYEITIRLEPASRGSGLGSKAIDLVFDLIPEFYALVRLENTHSRHLFEVRSPLPPVLVERTGRLFPRYQSIREVGHSVSGK